MTNPVPRVLVPITKLVVVSENHGGYLGGTCVACGANGWMDRLVHKPGCAVGKVLGKKRVVYDGRILDKKEAQR